MGRVQNVKLCMYFKTLTEQGWMAVVVSFYCTATGYLRGQSRQSTLSPFSKAKTRLGVLLLNSRTFLKLNPDQVTAQLPTLFEHFYAVR